MARTLIDIIDDIRHSWKHIPVPARFYLEDLEYLTDDNKYGIQSAILVKAFVESAYMWQGETAALLKDELWEKVIS